MISVVSTCPLFTIGMWSQNVTSYCHSHVGQTCIRPYPVQIHTAQPLNMELIGISRFVCRLFMLMYETTVLSAFTRAHFKDVSTVFGRLVVISFTK